MITRWDELEPVHKKNGHIAGDWYSLTGERSVTVGVNRITVPPGKWSTPLHVEGSEEEIFYVLGGSGISVRYDDETLSAYEVGPGDCLVHLPLEFAHTLQAGPDGLDVLAFGERHYPLGSTRLPRAGVSWGLGSWVQAGAPEDHPWKREAAAGPPGVPEPSPRPSSIVNLADVEPVERLGETVGFSSRHVSNAAGSLRTGMRHVTGVPGLLSVAPHCHSAEEEIFVVLGGEGTLLLWDGDEPSEHPLRAGTTVARPAGTRVAHSFASGDDPLVYLAYGTREPNDICFYPRSNKLFFRGVGVIARVERLDYWDGEE